VQRYNRPISIYIERARTVLLSSYPRRNKTIDSLGLFSFRGENAAHRLDRWRAEGGRNARVEKSTWRTPGDRGERDTRSDTEDQRGVLPVGLVHGTGGVAEAEGMEATGRCPKTWRCYCPSLRPFPSVLPKLRPRRTRVRTHACTHAHA